VIGPISRTADSVASSELAPTVFSAGEVLYGTTRQIVVDVFAPDLPAYDSYGLTRDAHAPWERYGPVSAQAARVISTTAASRAQHRTENPVDIELEGRARLLAANPASDMRRCNGVALDRAVALDLPTDRARRTAQRPRHLPDAALALQHARHRHTILRLELLITFRGDFHPLTLLGWQVLQFTFESAPFASAHAHCWVPIPGKGVSPEVPANGSEESPWPACSTADIHVSAQLTKSSTIC
jgi:hypothetical protein